MYHGLIDLELQYLPFLKGDGDEKKVDVGQDDHLLDF
jgi:hypothetical protein